MINKQLIDFNKEKDEYELKIKNAKEEELISINKDFLNILKLYLFEANHILKETFNCDPSPFYKEEGYNGLYKKGGTEIKRKTKEEYYEELDSLINSSSYTLLEDTQKALINNAIYILKKYYEDSLI